MSLMAERIRAALARWSDGGALPVVIDASSCSHGLISDVAPEGDRILDSIEWVHDHLLERLSIAAPLGTRRRAPDLLGDAPRAGARS